MFSFYRLRSFFMILITYRRLLMDMTARDLRNRYAGSYVGLFWTILVPLLSSVVYVAVFSVLMRGSLQGEYAHLNFTVFYFTGFTPWFLFSEVLIRNLGIIRENANIVTKVFFPNSILPLSVFLSSLVAHTVLILFCIALIYIYGFSFSHRFYFLPVYLIFLFLITMGLSFFFAAISVFIKDLSEIIPIFLNLLFFSTPILYPYHLFNEAPKWAQYLLTANPFYHIAEGYRISLINLDVRTNIYGIIILSAYSIFFILLGIYTFAKLKPSFADVL